MKGTQSSFTGRSLLPYTSPSHRGQKARGGRGRDRSNEEEVRVATLVCSPGPPRCSPLPPTWRGLEGVGQRVSLSTGGRRRKPYRSHGAARLQRTVPAPRLSGLPVTVATASSHARRPSKVLRLCLCACPGLPCLASSLAGGGEGEGGAGGRLGQASASGQKVFSVCVLLPVPRGPRNRTAEDRHEGRQRLSRVPLRM